MAPLHELPFSPEELALTLRVMETLAADRSHMAHLDRERCDALIRAAGALSRPLRSERKRLQKEIRRRDRALARAADEQKIAATGMRSDRRSSSFVLPVVESAGDGAELSTPRDCYICKASFRRLHHFYDSLCPPCAALNYQKRLQTVPLDGRVALVTGARVKIGYQTALILLRAGATVVATTRFPHDAALRFAREPDFAAWQGRLQIHGLDLRHLPSVERLARHLDGTLDRLDVLINNAAQTVRRPPAFYRHLLDGEARLVAELPAAAQPLLAAHAQLASPGLPAAAQLSQLAFGSADGDERLFPAGWVDGDQQQVDLRPFNSWRMTAAEVPTVELLEVHLVNAVAPFLLASRLKPLMMRRRTDEKHIINVSAMEAQFARNKKTDKHPHTNMAKAALNMLTRTSAVDYAGAGIYMNSVDTGWITDEDPLVHVARKQVVHRFHPPLDAVDGAARVLDPLFVGLRTDEHPWGQFFKDYAPTAW